MAIDWSANDYQDVFNDYLLEQSRKVSTTKTVPHVSIFTVVGKNGSGKSSVVEFVIRLVNNYAADKEKRKGIYRGILDEDNGWSRHYISRCLSLGVRSGAL